MEQHDMQMEKMLQKLRKDMIVTRVFCAVTSVLVLGLLVCFLVAGNTVKGYVEEFRPAIAQIEELKEIDFAKVNETLDNLNATVEAVDWEEVSAQMSILDVEAINSAVESLDTESLMEAVDNLNEAAKTLEKVKGLFSKFGI